MSANQAISLAIEKLTSAASAEARAALYEAMLQGNLLLAGNTDHLPRGKSVLAEDTHIDLLCTQSPSGGKALVAFTDMDSLRKRTSVGGFVELSTASVLELVINSKYDGLIINPAGPWAGIPVADIQTLLKRALTP